jgi:DNA-binding response OmpR family regulator
MNPPILTKRPLVLIVEDDSDLGLSIVEYLNEEGLDAKLARDGDQAMRMVDSLSPAVMVLDLMMPRRDGFSVLRELRSDGRIATLPVIVVTAIFGLSERLYATELGAADYITKPFKLEDLLGRIAALLPAGARPPGSSSQARPEPPAAS